MKFHLLLAAVAALAAASLHAQAPTPAAEPDLPTQLRDALFEEEANHDLPKAAAGYEALLAKWAGQRPLAAAALYRLAEVRRKQDRKDDAIKLYQRLLTEFPDIDPHARLSRENLTVLGVKESPPLAAVSIPTDPDEEKELRRLMMLAENSPDKVLEPVAWPESGSKDGKIGPLCNAAMRGWAKVAAFLLDHGAGPNANGFLGGSPLYAAAANGHKAICEILFDKGARIETAGGALGKAIASSYTAVAELLIAKGVDINYETTVYLDEANRRGWLLLTPLAVAISRDNKSWIDRLLALEADVNAASNGPPALQVAAWRGNRTILQKLLDLGANPDAPDAAHYNTAAEFRNPTTDASGWRALHYAATDAGMTEALLKAGANPSIADSHGLTPLHVACLRGELACVKLLLAAKSNVNASGTIQRNPNGVPEYSGITPLHAAALTANPAVIEALLAAGANPNPHPAIDSGQNPLTPLALAMDAVIKDNPKGPAAIAALLKAKADPNGSKDSNLNLVLAALAIPDAALRDSLLAMLIAHGADPEPAIQSAPVSVRIPLLRSHRYPKLAAEPAITLSIGHMLYQKSLSRRAQPEEKPASLPALLLAWHDDDKVRNGGDYGGPEPDWSTLHLWRKGDSGKLTETVLPLKPGMDFPPLQWGDVIEVLSSKWDKAPEPPSPNLTGRPWVRAGFASPASFMLRLPPATLAILRSSQSARITFKTGDFSKSLTLRGVLRTYDFTTAEAPLLPIKDLVTLLAGNRPGMVKLERSAERGGGTLEWATGEGNGSALPEEGDTITFTPDAPKADYSRVSLCVPGQPGVWQNAEGDQSPTLLQFLGDLYGSLPFEQVLPEEARGRDQRAASLKALTPEQAAFNLVSGSGISMGRSPPHWPDWSGIKVRRRTDTGKWESTTIEGREVFRTVYAPGEPESIDLLTAMQSLTPESTPEDARKFDLQLNPGDEVELPVHKDHPPGPWPGFDEAALRLFTKAFTAKVTVVDPDGRFRETTRAWLPPRWLSTPAGLLPLPEGDATGGRTPGLRARDLADSVAPGLRVSQVIRDAAGISPAFPGEVFLRPGDILHLQSGGIVPRPAGPAASLTPPLPGRGLPSNGP